LAITPLAAPANGTPVELSLEFPDNRLLIELCGEFDRNLAQIEHLLSVHVLRRGNQLAVLGDAREAAVEVLKKLYTRLEAGRGLDPGDIDAAIRLGGSAEGTGARA
jgi:phosphate starvation-inducible PhoH-like protein